MSYLGKEKRFNRMLPDIGNIRLYFSEIHYIDIHTEEIDVYKENSCFLIEANEYGELCKIVRFNNFSEILSYLNLQSVDENLGAITASYGSNKETIYNLDTQDYILISRTFSTEETIFITSSTKQVEEPIELGTTDNIKDENTDEDVDPRLIPTTKLHFYFMNDWFKYQDDYLKKFRRQQGQEL